MIDSEEWERKPWHGWVPFNDRDGITVKFARALKAAGGLAVVELNTARGGGYYVFTLGGVAEGFRADTMHEALCYANMLGSAWPRWAELVRIGDKINGPVAEARAISRERNLLWNMRGGWLGADLDFSMMVPG